MVRTGAQLSSSSDLSLPETTNRGVGRELEMVSKTVPQCILGLPIFLYCELLALHQSGPICRCRTTPAPILMSGDVVSATCSMEHLWGLLVGHRLGATCDHSVVNWRECWGFIIRSGLSARADAKTRR